MTRLIDFSSSFSAFQKTSIQVENKYFLLPRQILCFQLFIQTLFYGATITHSELANLNYVKFKHLWWVTSCKLGEEGRWSKGFEEHGWNPSIRTATNVKVHEKLISKACFLRCQEWSERERKGKVIFIFGLFCGFMTVSWMLVFLFCFSLTTITNV